MFERLDIDRGAILFDPQRVAVPGEQLFDPAHWHAQGALTQLAGGRGSIQFIDNDEHRWVIRRYLRGGVPALIARESYLYIGEERTRAFRELRLLAALRERELPVPAPVAARYVRDMVTYRAEIITERLPGARSLSEVIDAGVQHADLNAHNIMLGEHREVWVLDFDRGRLRHPGSWSRRVLDRLARSLAKISAGANEWQAGFALL